MQAHAAVVQRAKEEKKTIFASLIDLCHLKNEDLAKNLQKNKGRAVLQGDNVKDECGYRDAFAEQGAQRLRWQWQSA